MDAPSLVERLGKFTPFVRKTQLHQGPLYTAAERNVRVPVGVSPQAAPDPPAQGLIPSRHAYIPVVTFAYDMGVTLDDPRFQQPNFAWNPIVARPPGRQTPVTLRQNIAAPAHVAYGSMMVMNYNPQPYWG